MNPQFWANQAAASIDVSEVLPSADAVYVAETETPTPRPTFNPDDVGPGIESFLIAFILAVALLGLLWSMTRHLRRVQVRARVRDEYEAAMAGAPAAEEAGAGGDHAGAGNPDASTPDKPASGPGTSSASDS